MWITRNRLRLIWVVLVCVTLGCESVRWLTPDQRQAALAGWLFGLRPDWLPWLAWLLLAPVIVWAQGEHSQASKAGLRGWWQSSAADREWDKGCLIASLGLAVAGWWGTVHLGDQLADVQPAYHDEYSYLMQGETFRDGRTWYPVASKLPQLFDQIHVLNEPDLEPPEGRRACRYFPGTGLWLAGCFWLGDFLNPHQFAQILVVVGLFWIGRELANNGTGVLAGVLGAGSPGLNVFSNLVLAHLPTLVGLTLFYWLYLRGRRTGDVCSLFLSGTGLAFAMSCRPMTAAGASLIPGLVFGWWWLTGRGTWLLSPTSNQAFGQRTQSALALGGPLVLALGGLSIYNHSVTGNWTESPYQLYTDRYTPRHVYGFNNVVRGEQHLGPKVIDNYDRWAENLTPALALKNVGIRLISSARWTLGIVPLMGITLLFLLVPECRAGRQVWVPWSGIIGLHLAHVPYWFTGIMDWHYVFETAPLWLLLAALVGGVLATRPGLSWWVWSGFGLALLVNNVTVPPLWPAPVDVAIAELRYPGEKYQRFREGIERLRNGQEVLVLVTPDPADRSMDYVTNPGNLTGPVLIGRWRGEPLEEIRLAFPNRLLLYFDAHKGAFSRTPR